MNKLILSFLSFLFLTFPSTRVDKKFNSKGEGLFAQKVQLADATKPCGFGYDISLYSWFAFSVENQTYYLADVLNQTVFDSTLFEMRLIVNAKENDGIPPLYLSDSNSFCLEVITQSNGKPKADYYKLDSSTSQSIIKNAKLANSGSEIEKRLTTSFNFYFSNTSFSNITTNQASRVRNNAAEPKINSQAPLDYFLKTKEIQKTYLDYSTFAYPDENNPTHYSLDSAITALLPKSIFTSEG